MKKVWFLIILHFIAADPLFGKKPLRAEMISVPIASADWSSKASVYYDNMVTEVGGKGGLVKGHWRNEAYLLEYYRENGYEAAASLQAEAIWERKTRVATLIAAPVVGAVLGYLIGTSRAPRSTGFMSESFNALSAISYGLGGAGLGSWIGFLAMGVPVSWVYGPKAKAHRVEAKVAFNRDLAARLGIEMQY